MVQHRRPPEQLPRRQRRHDRRQAGPLRRRLHRRPDPPDELRRLPGSERQQRQRQQALPRGRLPGGVAERQRLHLLHRPVRQPDGDASVRSAGQLVEARRHQRVLAHELPAHHAVDPGHVRQRPEPCLQRALHHPGQAVRERLGLLKKYFRSERSQGLTEFAIIAPIILLLTFGIIDFGRALYLYITLQQAANEGARVAVRASYFIDPNGASHTCQCDRGPCRDHEPGQQPRLPERTAAQRRRPPGLSAEARLQHRMDLHHGPEHRGQRHAQRSSWRPRQLPAAQRRRRLQQRDARDGERAHQGDALVHVPADHTDHPASCRQQHRHHGICRLSCRVLELSPRNASCKRARRSF
ncbi:MAG: pilus assembly protein [Chloroflexi bacterium]|nr:MAG: pilus assembly protein [Chloroflexota bacterium]